jgi:hypothetical protein
MTVINIGTSGSITYSYTGNTCYNLNDGSISISSIVFDDLYSAFTSYVINWSADNYIIDSDQIRDDGKSIISLYPNNYYFIIESLSSSSSLGPYSINITNTNQFSIVKLKSSEYSCGDNGTILIGISGGTPPYFFNVGATSISQNSTEYLATGLSPGSYDIRVTDNAGCSATNLTDYYSDNLIILRDSNFTITDLSITQPLLFDGYGQLDISISGYGPFGFSFTGSDAINYDSLNTTYLTSYDNINNIYSYSFNNSLSPGEYNLLIKNNFGCYSNIPVEIPNLTPITVSTSIISNNKPSSLTSKSVLPIFDTIFIPFINIQENTPLWQLIQKFIQQNKIDLRINNANLSQKISKNFLYPYCVNSNTIEIVRLDNDKNNWFFCFHIAPGINLLNNLDLISSEIFLVDKDNNKEYACIFGLNSINKISHDYPSLLMGCLFLQGIATEQFYNGCEVALNVTNSPASNLIAAQPTDSDIYDYLIKDIKNNIYYNIYNNAYITALYFLDNFNVLTQNIDINQTACTISNEDFQYIQNIKKMLLDINNFNNYQGLSIFNPDYISNLGSVTSYIIGNPTAIINNELIDNVFSIDYFTFDKNSDKLYSFYSNNQKISNTTLLDNIPDGYIIIRIQDINNNKPKFININNTSINYDNHFTSVQNLLQEFNPKIQSLFQYGDILVYVPKAADATNSSATMGNIPTTSAPIVTQTTQETGEIPISTISQSQDSTNTATISIITDPDDAICYLLGPKNYKHKFIGYATFDNVVPGVYNIVGDEDYLIENSLYQNNTRTIVLKNQDYNLSVKFHSYLDKVFIKE